METGIIVLRETSISHVVKNSSRNAFSSS